MGIFKFSDPPYGGSNEVFGKNQNFPLVLNIKLHLKMSVNYQLQISPPPTQTRGYQHRVGLYLQLLKMGHKVLAVDYRGFADSTELEDITETSVVEDAAAALRYLR